jgi:filamentous hemagglutinin family protein
MMNKNIKLWVASGIAFCCVSTTSPAQAQIAEDATVNTSVTTRDNTSLIEGGTVAGSNLFHSFEKFSVSTGSTAYFNNPLEIQNIKIENIISRVTGDSISNINGLIRANGTANLFLLNPNGIIFGSNARLDIGGSFVASTADSVVFDNNFAFGAVNPQVSPLLTVKVPLGLQFGANPGRIVNQSVEGLEVQSGRTLALVGGDVSLDGGILQARGGRVELGGVAASGTVGLNVDGNNLRLSFPDRVTRADVALTNAAQVNVRAGGGGSIAVNSQNLNMAGGSKLQAGIDSPLGSLDSKAGDIEINATGAINLTDSSSISNGVLAGGVGKGGEINIRTGSLFGTNGARLTTNASGQGDAGSVTIVASDTVSFDGVSSNGLSSGVLSIVERERTGKGGDISVTTGFLFLTNGAVMSAETFARGNGGSIRITASDTLSFDGLGSNGLSSGLLTGTRTPANGRGGDITVATGVLRLANGAVLSARTWNRYSGGNITVDANKLDLSGGGQLLTTAYSSGRAGNISVNATAGITISGSDPSFEARSAQFTDPSKLDQADAASGIFANTTPIPGVTDQGRATGPGGDINITTGQLIVRDGAKVAVDSKGSGNAGNLQATAGSIHLDNSAVLNAETTAGQGNINLETQDLVLRGGSKITTNATGNAIGGNITLKTGVLAAVENSDISANAQRGSGGQIIINTQGIFGTQYQDKLTPESDITATSHLGPQFSGIVQINSPDVDPSRGLANLPAAPVPTALIAQGCPANEENTFTLTGRGGLPPQPSDALRTEAVRVNQDTLASGVENRSASVTSTLLKSSAPAPLVEAQGWVVNAQGEVVLTAEAPKVTANSSWSTPPYC